MANTNLTATDTCSYNQSAAPYFWVSNPVQFSGTRSVGEMGISTSSGNVNPRDIDVSSYLSGRSASLTNCIPPAPSMKELEKAMAMSSGPEMRPTLGSLSADRGSLASQRFTREKKSVVDLSIVNTGRWFQEVPVDVQDPRHIIENFSEQRGGANTNTKIKLDWKSSQGSFRGRG